MLSMGAAAAKLLPRAWNAAGQSRKAHSVPASPTVAPHRARSAFFAGAGTLCRRAPFARGRPAAKGAATGRPVLLLLQKRRELLRISAFRILRHLVEQRRCFLIHPVFAPCLFFSRLCFPVRFMQTAQIPCGNSRLWFLWAVCRTFPLKPVKKTSIFSVIFTMEHDTIRRRISLAHCRITEALPWKQRASYFMRM